MTSLELARWQFGITTVYHFLFVPLTIGLAIAVAYFQTRWYKTGDEKLAARDPLLGQADARLVRDGRRHRDRPGVPVRHELVRLLALRRRHLRRAARDGGPRRVLRRVDLPRPLDLRLGPAAEEDPPGDDLARRRLDRAVGLLHPRRELVDAAPGRLRDGRRQGRADLDLGRAHQQHRALRLRPHDLRGPDHLRHGHHRRLRLAPAQGQRARGAQAHDRLRAARRHDRLDPDDDRRPLQRRC